VSGPPASPGPGATFLVVSAYQVMGAILRQLRGEARLQQTEVAEACGFDQRWVSDTERGLRVIRLDDLEAWRQAMPGYGWRPSMVVRATEYALGQISSSQGWRASWDPAKGRVVECAPYERVARWVWHHWPSIVDQVQGSDGSRARGKHVGVQYVVDGVVGGMLVSGPLVTAGVEVISSALEAITGRLGRELQVVRSGEYAPDATAGDVTRDRDIDRRFDSQVRHVPFTTVIDGQPGPDAHGLLRPERAATWAAEELDGGRSKEGPYTVNVTVRRCARSEGYRVRVRWDPEDEVPVGELAR
jgi:hypothetical protein